MKYTSFGTNNYSCGLEARVYDAQSHTVEEVRQEKGVFLNPFRKSDSLDIFALAGTQEQFDEYVRQTKRANACRAAHNRLGNWDFKAEEQPEYQNFIPWYE